MITERMTKQEIKAEINADIDNVSNYAQTLVQKFRRIVIKTNKFPICRPVFYTSKRKNKWIVIFMAFSKKDVGDLTRGIKMCYYNSNHGYYAVVYDYPVITIYAPHFFSRYAERKELDMHGIDLIVHYIRNNTNLVSARKEVERPDGSKETVLEGATQEGITLGLILPDDIILARTFITREMAKGDQIDEFNYHELLRKEVFHKGYL